MTLPELVRAPAVTGAGEGTDAGGMADLLGELAALRAHVRGETIAGDGRRAPALDTLQRALGLSDFERGVLLLAAGPELAAGTAHDLLERTGVAHLTFGAALAVLPDPHWSALSPRGPLRAWHLVRLDDPTSLTTSRLVVDEAVLHALVGLGLHDAVVDDATRALTGGPSASAARREAADRLAQAWDFGPVRLSGGGLDDAREIVVTAAEGAGARELVVARLPHEPRELAEVLRRCVRAAVLGAGALLVPLEHVASDRAAEIAAGLAGAPWVATHGGPAVGASLDVAPVPFADRADQLRAAFARVGVDPAGADDIATAFTLGADDADEVAFAASLGADAWDAARRLGRASGGALAHRFAPTARWDHLVVPEAVEAQLRALVATVAHRRLVREEWGFGEHLRRGLGTTAVFCGVTGTGKTFAAEVVAAALRHDVLRVDLSQVTSKYIGETEKHLAAVFEDAERGGAVLLFDEADAVFGKRTEVKDSHDRYANLEVSYLLERLERFRGLAILTTNARASLDAAFTRRLTSIVTFPYPDAAARREIWRRVLPERMPRVGLDLDRLARADVNGGSIAAAALAGASLAAAEGSPVTTAHLERALEWELAKTGRSAGRAG